MSKPDSTDRVVSGQKLSKEGREGLTMKIRDFAAEIGITPQAVYKAINRAGLSARALTNKSGNLTSKGLSELRKLFSEDQDEDQPEQRPERSAQDQDELARLRLRVDQLDQEVSLWQKRYFDLVESSNQERAQLRILIDQEQKLRAAAEHKGLIRRLFSGKKEKEGSDSQ